MAAAYKAYTSAFNTQHVMPVIVTLTTATSGDWTTLPYMGFFPLAGTTASIAANAAPAFTYATAAVNNGGAAYTATSTSIVVGTAAVTRSATPYYVLTGGGEIMQVISETDRTNAASTWTVRRGCFGTTAIATGLANTNVVHILNMVILTNTPVGITVLYGVPMPDEYKAPVAAAQR